MEIHEINSNIDADLFLIIETKKTINRKDSLETLKALKLKFTIDKEKLEREIASRPEGRVNDNTQNTVIGLHFLLKRIPVLSNKLAFEEVIAGDGLISNNLANFDDDDFIDFEDDAPIDDDFDINYPEN